MKKLNYTSTVGRRKTSSARVRLFKGEGVTTVNGKSIETYFPGAVNAKAWKKPFGLTETTGKYYATVRVIGGGIQSQLDAVVHGISRAMAKVKADTFRKPLKKAGLLTRDSRERQRRMVGKGGKSRRGKQSPKR